MKAAPLTCSGLAVRFGARAVLRDIALSLAPGTVTAIVGPNGAGKSTLMACFAGLHRPTIGQIRLGPDDLFALKPRDRARRLGFLPQSAEIAWPIEVSALVALGRTPFIGARGPSVEDTAAVGHAMATAGVSAFADRLVSTLSGGERARVLIARALAGQPEWLLADEPLTGLDPGHQLDAVALLRTLADGGTGVVVTLHDLARAARAAERIVVMADGVVLADDVPQAALTPDILRHAYGIEAQVRTAETGMTIDVLRRARQARDL
ncbi:ABC transporter ATP-binding protein [soil metagenome]